MVLQIYGIGYVYMENESNTRIQLISKYDIHLGHYKIAKIVVLCQYII